MNLNSLMSIAQVQWYSLGDTLHLIGIGFLLGGVIIGTLVYLSVGAVKEYKEDPKNSLYPPQTPKV